MINFFLSSRKAQNWENQSINSGTTNERNLTKTFGNKKIVEDAKDGRFNRIFINCSCSTKPSKTLGKSSFLSSTHFDTY